MNIYKIKNEFRFAYYWFFNRKLYRDGRKFQEAMKSPEVQEALDKVLKTIIADAATSYHRPITTQRPVPHYKGPSEMGAENYEN